MSKREEIGTVSKVRGLSTTNHFKSQTSHEFIDPNSSERHRLSEPKAPSKSVGSTPAFSTDQGTKFPSSLRTDTVSGRTRTRTHMSDFLQNSLYYANLNSDLLKTIIHNYIFESQALFQVLHTYEFNHLNYFTRLFYIFLLGGIFTWRGIFIYLLRDH